MIPAAAPQLRLARFGEAVEAAVHGVLTGGDLVLGPPVERFEQRFASYLGTAHCVGVASGTDALELALRACGIGPGDEVVVPAMTAAATAMAVLRIGARPRIVDVDAGTRCLDPGAVDAAIGPRTAAIVPVHLHGRLADMARLREVARRHGLALVEDCAQAHGARDATGRRAGTFGDAAAFSFYPTKNLGAAGDGGAVVTADAAVAERVRAARSYGWSGPDRVSRTVGFCSRLDAVQAAILDVLLDHLDTGNQERSQIAGTYRAALRPAAEAGALALPPADPGAVHHQFAIEAEGRDALRAWLAEQGIGTGVHYDHALHQQPALAAFADAPVLPVAEGLAARLLSLPVQPEVVGDRAEWIAGTVAEGVARWAPAS